MNELLNEQQELNLCCGKPEASGLTRYLYLHMDYDPDWFFFFLWSFLHILVKFNLIMVHAEDRQRLVLLNIK